MVRVLTLRILARARPTASSGDGRRRERRRRWSRENRPFFFRLKFRPCTPGVTFFTPGVPHLEL